MIFVADFHKKCRTILQIMVPILVTQLAISGMGFFDTVMSGRAGNSDLAGVAIGGNVWMPIFTGLSGVLMALTPIIAQLRGADKKQEIGRAVFHGMFLALCLGILTIVGGYFFLPFIFDRMTLTAEVRTIANNYLGTMAIGFIPLYGSIILRSLVDTMGFTRLTMRLVLLTFPVNTFFNYIMIFGKFGMPRMGGAGAGAGTAVTCWLLFFAFVWVIKRLRVMESLEVFHWYKLEGHKIREHLSIGIPMGVAIFCETSIFCVVAFFIANYGTDAVAAHQAAMSLSNLLYMVPMSFSLALTIIVGVRVGAKDYEGAGSYALTGIAANLMTALFLSLLLFVSRRQIAGLYSTDPFMVALITKFLLYAVAFQFFDGTAAPIQGILRGYKDVKATFLSSLVAYWCISLPMGIFLDQNMKQGYFGYWQGLIIGIFFSAVFMALRLRYIRKKVLQ